MTLFSNLIQLIRLKGNLTSQETIIQKNFMVIEDTVNNAIANPTSIVNTSSSNLTGVLKVVNGFVCGNASKSDIGLSNVPNTDCSTTANITDSINKRFLTDSEKTAIDNIPAAQVNSDFKATSGASQILNAPEITIPVVDNTSTDNTTIIQNTLSSAPAGSIVRLPMSVNGYYKTTNTITVPIGISFIQDAMIKGYVTSNIPVLAVG